MQVNMCIQSSSMELARKNKSTEFCKELSVPEQREGCIFAVTMIRAQENKDPAVCNTLSGNYKDQCAMSIIRAEAQEKRDIKLCDTLPKGESGSTSSIPETAQDDCRMNIIMMDTASTPKSCDAITTPQMRDMCSSMIRSRATQPTPNTSPIR